VLEHVGSHRAPAVRDCRGTAAGWRWSSCGCPSSEPHLLALQENSASRARGPGRRVDLTDGSPRGLARRVGPRAGVQHRVAHRVNREAERPGTAQRWWSVRRSGWGSEGDMRAIPTAEDQHLRRASRVLGDSLTPVLLTRFAQAFRHLRQLGAHRIGPATAHGRGRWCAQSGGGRPRSRAACRIVDIGVCPVADRPSSWCGIRWRTGLASPSRRATTRPSGTRSSSSAKRRAVPPVGMRRPRVVDISTRATTEE